MMALGIRCFLTAICMAAVMYTPMAHTLKLLIGGTQRYQGVVVANTVRPTIPDNDLILFGDDRFMPPFLDLIAKKYKDGTGRKLHWIFPPLMGSRVIEEAMVADFVCLIAENEKTPITWLLNRGTVTASATVSNRVRIDLNTAYGQFSRRLLVDFDVDDVLYEVHDAIFLRGGVSRVVVARANEGEEEVLYPDPALSSGCSGNQGKRNSRVIGELN